MPPREHHLLENSLFLAHMAKPLECMVHHMVFGSQGEQHRWILTLQLTAGVPTASAGNHARNLTRKGKLIKCVHRRPLLGYGVLCSLPDELWGPDWATISNEPAKYCTSMAETWRHKISTKHHLLDSLHWASPILGTSPNGYSTEKVHSFVRLLQFLLKSMNILVCHVCNTAQ
jgi:hypothetical protein